jgi:hypothetical protein
VQKIESTFPNISTMVIGLCLVCCQATHHAHHAHKAANHAYRVVPTHKIPPPNTFVGVAVINRQPRSERTPLMAVGAPSTAYNIAMLGTYQNPAPDSKFALSKSDQHLTYYSSNRCMYFDRHSVYAYVLGDSGNFAAYLLDYGSVASAKQIRGIHAVLKSTFTGEIKFAINQSIISGDATTLTIKLGWLIENSKMEACCCEFICNKVDPAQVPIQTLSTAGGEISIVRKIDGIYATRSCAPYACYVFRPHISFPVTTHLAELKKVQKALALAFGEAEQRPTAKYEDDDTITLKFEGSSPLRGTILTLMRESSFLPAHLPGTIPPAW